MRPLPSMKKSGQALRQGDRSECRLSPTINFHPHWKSQPQPVTSYYANYKRHQTVDLKPNAMSYTSTYAGLPYTHYQPEQPLAEKIEYLEGLLKEHPEDELDFVRFLLSFTKDVKEKHPRCLELADRLLLLAEDEEDTMDALLTKADVLWEDRMDIDLAEKLYVQAHTCCPDYQQPYEKLVAIHLHRKEPDKAMHWAERMIGEEELDHLGLKLKGDVLDAMGRFEEALEVYHVAVERSKHPSEAYFGLARSYIGMNNYTSAREASLNAFHLCHYPEAAYAYSVGYCYQMLDDPYRAMQWYCKALDIDASHVDALNNMAVLNLELDNGWKEALPYLLKAVRVAEQPYSESMKVVYRNLYAYYNQVLEFEQAKYYKEQILKCFGFDDDAAGFLADLDEE